MKQGMLMFACFSMKSTTLTPPFFTGQRKHLPGACPDPSDQQKPLPSAIARPGDQGRSIGVKQRSW